MDPVETKSPEVSEHTLATLAEGLDLGDSVVVPPSIDDAEDPLLDLFRRKVQLTTEAFLIELRRQRGSGSEAPGRTVCT